MKFQITALSAAAFAAYFAMPDAELAQHLGRRVTATAHPGFPCRVSLADAELGEELLLINHTHLPAASPFHASHAIFIRRDAVQAHPATNEIPAMLRSRTLSLRAFDSAAMLIAADLAAGATLGAALVEMLADPAAAHVDIHFAKQGCFAARARRA
jgi:hypothetical protein